MHTHLHIHTQSLYCHCFCAVVGIVIFFSFQMVMYLFISAYFVVLSIVIFVMIVYNYCDLPLLLFISECDVNGCCFCSSALLCLLPYHSLPCPFLYCVFSPVTSPWESYLEEKKC